MSYKKKYKSLCNKHEWLNEKYKILQKELQKYYQIGYNMEKDIENNGILADCCIRLTWLLPNGLEEEMDMPQVVRINGDKYTKNEEEHE